MDTDDFPVGRVLTRREAVTLLGSAGALAWLGRFPPRSRPHPAAAGPCVVRPAMTPGPYYVDEKLDRSDIRRDPTDGTVKAGAALLLTLSVARITKDGCAPLQGAIVDLWQCDAEGVYSDAVDPRYFDTTGRKFLRGYQITDASGVVTFTTIYPGWYPTRTPHIHYKIRAAAPDARAYELVSQMYFDEALSDRIYARPPYAGRGKRTVSNLTDRIYRESGGRQSMLAVTPANDGYAARFDVALDMDGGGR
jgi:protocatechuate 3,4-dioxygenase beta subunit